jgi:TP901 family phage tail tape measure protein
MSEQVEIEVSANLTKFNTGMNQIRNSVQRVAGNISRLDFSQSDRSMAKLKTSSKESAKEANTLRGLFRQIASTKISSQSLKDFAEIFKEISRLVKEFGPLFTLAMNAADGTIRNFLNSNTKLLTQVERLSSNFLLLRKVLPVRIWRVMAVGSARVSTSIVGMSNDIVDFAKFGTNATRTVIGAFGKLMQGGKATADAIKNMSAVLNSGQIKKSSSTFKELGRQTRAMGQNMLKSVKDFRSADSVMGKLGATMRMLGSQSKTLGTITGVVGLAFGKSIANSVRLGSAMRGLRSVVRGLNPSKVALKVSSIALSASFATLLGTSKVLVRTLSRVSGVSSRMGFKTLSSGARQAVAPIKGIVQGVRNIATRPIQTATSAFGKMAKVGGGALTAVTAIGGAMAVFGRLVMSNADGAVASFNKNFRKAMAELPNEAQGSFGQVRKEIMALQNELGITADDALPALQQAFRKGFDSDNAVGAVRQSMLLAKTGAVDLEGAINIVGNSMRAFSKEGLTASQVSDSLFRATRGVDVNMGSLGDSIKRLGPDLASTGLGFNDFLGSLKTLTQQGRLGATAIGEIRTLTASIVSPSEEAREAMGKLGLNFAKADMAGRGLGAILQEVKNATGGNAEAMAQVLGGQENLNTALLLGAQNGARLTKNLDEITNSTSGVAQQADKMDTAFSRAMKKLSARTETLKIELSDMLNPLMARLVDLLATWTNTFKNMMQVALALFKGGNLGEVLYLGISIGLKKAIVAVLNFGQGVRITLANSFKAGVEGFPKLIGAVIPNILARLGKIGFFFIELGAQFVRAMETPIAYLTAGLKKAVEEAGDAINKLPFVGGDKASKARAFEVILKQELKNSGGLSKEIQGFAEQGFRNADALIEKTNQGTADFVNAQMSAIKDGFAEGANVFKLPESTKKDQERLGDLIKGAMADVEKAGKTTARMAKDAELQVGEQVAKAVGNEGNERGITQGDQVIASSLAQIGGGGGVFSTMASVAREQVGILKQQLEEAKMQTRLLNEQNLGGRVME